MDHWISRRQRVVGTLLVAPMLALTLLPTVTQPVAAQAADGDGDGLYDDDEQDVYGTDPWTWDTDGDGSSDGEEVHFGTDPLGW